MSGPAVQRGRHPHHRRRHPGRHRRGTGGQPHPLPRRGPPPGHHHLRDQVRLRPDRRGRGPRPAHRRRATPTRSPTSAPTSSPPTTPTTRPATSPWSPARCSTPAPRTPAGSTSSARRAPSTATRPARSSPRARRKGLHPRIHANQLSYGPGVQLAVELDAASADHCTHLTDADVDALANSRTVATLLPGAEFSTRAAVAGRPPAAGRGRHRRPVHGLQPGLVLHLVRAVLHRARRTGHGDDARTRRCGRPRRAGPGPAPRRRRPPRPPAPAPT